MKTIILCGGKGTRLREETEFRPKPMVEIGEKPILWHIMKSYAHYGYSDFILCLGYKGRIIKDYFINHRLNHDDVTVDTLTGDTSFHKNDDVSEAFKVTLAETGLESSTGYRVLRAAKHLDDDDGMYMVTYGDGVSDVDISQLVEFHKSHGRLATVTTVQPTSRFGSLGLDASGKVIRFEEKPQSDGWINAGFFVFNKEALDYIDSDPNCMLEHRPLERLAEDGELIAYKHDGFFYAMDTHKDFTCLNELWASGEAPWDMRE